MKVIASPLLTGLRGVRHAFFTREGGVSKGVYESLNVGRGSNDDPAAVEENRARAAAHFGLSADALSTCYQIHSAIALYAGKPFGEARPQADGVITDRPGIICGALSADCAPILFADVEARLVGAAHAGWRGALDGVSDAAIEQMIAHGARRERIIAAVGPCIGPASYEVGAEFVDRFVAADPANVRYFAEPHAPGKQRFDLPAYVVGRLRAAGVAEADWTGHDTCADQAFFSNRRAVLRGEADYGRLLSAIVLEA